jgi:UDP-glucose:(heptosyl)LPS alpha-1,3-glucosyltransferase
MKIGLVIERLDPRRGGAEQWACEHAEQLLSRGYEVHVVAESIAGPAERLNVVPHVLGTSRSVVGRAEAAEKMLRGLGLDVIHDIGMGWYNHIFQSEDGSRMAQWEQKLHRLPAWVRPWKRAMIRTLPRYRDFRRLMARQFGDPGRIVVAISQMCARDYEHYHSVPPERIRLVYHGIDTARFSPDHRRRWRDATRRQLGIGNDEVVFLFVGHDYARKGLATAVRAVQRLAAEGLPVRLLVVGGRRHDRFSSLGGPLRRVVLRVGAADDPVPHYAAADAVVLPTFYDPFGLVVFEAAASSLPVVTTRMAGASELLHDGIDGCVVCDPADDRELAQRLRPLMDGRRRTEMGGAARQLALRHTVQRSCDEIVALYHEIAGRRRAAA